jgi:hypothetical protein
MFCNLSEAFAQLGNMDQAFNSPMTQFGLGILAANQPGASFGQAVGQGGLTAMQNMQRMGELKEKSEYRKLQAEQLKAEMERAKADADRQAKMDAARAEWLRANPQYADLASMGGFDPVADILKAQLMPVKPENDPEAYRSWKLAGSPGSYEDWYFRGKVSPTTNVTVAPVFNPLEKGVASDLQKQSISAKTVRPLIKQLISDTQLLPGGVGGVAEARESVGGVLGQLADIGVPGARGLSDAVRPEIEVADPNAPGGKRKISGQTLRTQSETLAIRLKPLMADSGPLSNQDRLGLNTALADAGSADSQRRIEALMTVDQVLAENAEVIDKFLRVGGSAVPGETTMPRVNSQSELQSLNLKDGDQFIAPDGSVRTYRKR